MLSLSRLVSCYTCILILAEIEVFGVFPAHRPSVLDAGTVLVSVPWSICAGFVYCHCTGRWAMSDNTHGKDSGASMALTTINQKYMIS